MSETHIVILETCIEFGRRIQAARIMKGMKKRSELAKKLGVGTYSLRDFEMGRRWPKQEIMQKLFKILPNLYNEY